MPPWHQTDERTPPREDLQLATAWMAVLSVVVLLLASLFTVVTAVARDGWALVGSGAAVVGALLAVAAAVWARHDWERGMRESERMIGRVLDAAERLEKATASAADRDGLSQAQRAARELLDAAFEDIDAMESAGARHQAARLTEAADKLASALPEDGW